MSTLKKGMGQVTLYAVTGSYLAFAVTEPAKAAEGQGPEAPPMDSFLSSTVTSTSYYSIGIEALYQTVTDEKIAERPRADFNFKVAPKKPT